MKGNQMPLIKLSESQRWEISYRASCGESVTVLAKEFDVTVQYVRKIARDCKRELKEEEEKERKRLDAGEDLPGCIQCGKTIQFDHKFCSDNCKNAWNSDLESLI